MPLAVVLVSGQEIVPDARPSSFSRAPSWLHWDGISICPTCSMAGPCGDAKPAVHTTEVSTADTQNHMTDELCAKNISLSLTG